MYACRYLGELTDITGEEELKAKARLVRSVIKNMKDKDVILMEVTQEENERALGQSANAFPQS